MLIVNSAQPDFLFRLIATCYELMMATIKVFSWYQDPELVYLIDGKKEAIH